MITEYTQIDKHERFEELSALAISGALSPVEWAELKGHLENCEECRAICRQYNTLAKEGFAILAGSYSHPQQEGDWDDTKVRARLMARVQASESAIAKTPVFDPSSVPRSRPFVWIVRSPLAQAALAACFVFVVGLGGYRLGVRTHPVPTPTPIPIHDRAERLLTEKETLNELLDAQTKKLSLLQEEVALKEGALTRKEEELARLRSALRTLEDHSDQLKVASSASEEQLRSVSKQRDALNAQLRDTEESYRKTQTEFAGLRAERDNALQQTTSLGSENNLLSAINRDQERRIKEQEQYLAADRDIRELMGARQLYIADVFDVDSGSRTRRPYGRMFYTQGKSLIFYAFDLDRQPGSKNASTFQAWGRKETVHGEQERPVNLGILYKDSESNRRWILRCDDPKQLAEIDSVFVTIEPRSGSQKPTGKPFLYALLRKEANHP
jgi:hypothetical protein